MLKSLMTNLYALCFISILSITFVSSSVKRAKSTDHGSNTVFYQDKSFKPQNIDDSCSLNIQCPNNLGNQIKLPIYGPKGEMGPPGVPGIKGEKGEPGVAGIPAPEPPIPNFSAFFAALKNNTGPVTQDMTIAFNHVITNYGNDYDPETGIYTAPYNGVYQFYITISATGRQKAGVNVMKNNNPIITVWSESYPWSTTTQTIIVKLNIDDQLYLKLQSRASHLHGYFYSNFGGTLLHEEFNQK